MKLKKRLIGAGLTLAAAVLLTACGQSASDGKTYSSTFGADPTTFNYLLDYAGDNTAIVTNLVDGLLENDNYGNLIPALAELIPTNFAKMPSGLQLTVRNTLPLKHKTL